MAENGRKLNGTVSGETLREMVDLSTHRQPGC